MGSTTGIDNTDLTTNAELVAVRNESLREVLRKNVYGNDMKFTIQALCDATPMSSETLRLYTSSPTDVTNSNSSAVYNWIFRGRIVDFGLQRPSPHIFLTDPCDITNTPNKIKGVMTQMQQLYTEIIISSDKPKKIKRGDQVVVSMRKGQPYQFDLQFAFCDGAIEEAESSDRLEDMLQCQKLSDLDFDRNAVAPLTLLVSDPGEGKVILGSGLPSITGIVESELSFWQGKTEKMPEAYSTLQKYYDNLGTTEWTTDTAWSAVFISWVVMQADPGFPGSIGHHFYVKGAVEGRGGWSGWKVGDAKIRAQLGDVLVYPRYDPKNPTAAHGDVVYKIENNIAYLAGGNLGAPSHGTAKVADQLAIDSEGNYTNFKKYITVLKKGGAAYDEDALT